MLPLNQRFFLKIQNLVTSLEKNDQTSQPQSKIVTLLVIFFIVKTVIKHGIDNLITAFTGS